jgi:hypothetical protein
MKPDGRPKGATSKPELYILMHMGYKPKQLIQMGFKPAMVYNYSHKYKAILERLAVILTSTQVKHEDGGAHYITAKSSVISPATLMSNMPKCPICNKKFKNGFGVTVHYGKCHHK